MPDDPNIVIYLAAETIERCSVGEIFREAHAQLDIELAELLAHLRGHTSAAVTAYGSHHERGES